MDFTSIKCPVCDRVFIDGDDIVVCPKCGAPYHRECYESKGKCIFPDLHKSKTSWKDYNAEKNAESVSAETDDGLIPCLRCGHRNPKDCIVCERCGNFLPPPESRKMPDYFGQNFEDEPTYNGDDSGRIPPDFFRGGAVNFGQIRDFSIGVKKDDDFDGVTGEELMAFVKANEMYYGPVFSNMKKKKTMRFNFATFFFFDVWYFFRKQYLKGILACLLTIFPIILNFVCARYFTGDLWSQAQQEIGSSDYVNYLSYLNWIRNNCDFLHGMMMLLPYIVNILVIAAKVVFSFKANKGYYGFCLDRIRKVKKENEDLPHDELIGILHKRGGVNPGIAFSVFACELIIASAVMMF